MVFEKLTTAVRKRADAYNIAGVKRANDRALADPRLHPARELAEGLKRVRDSLSKDRQEVADRYIDNFLGVETFLRTPTLEFDKHHAGRKYLVGLASQIPEGRYGMTLESLKTNPSYAAVLAFQIDRTARYFAGDRE